jgi:hypothetical protein
MNIRKHLSIVVIVLGVIFTSNSISFAQKYTEYEVKLVYLYQFAKFINWPQDTFNESSHFIIGVYGQNPFGDLPDIIYKDRLFKGKPCKVINVSSAKDAQKCHMLFISGLKKFDALMLIKQMELSSVLLVGDEIEDFCTIGGIINLTSKESSHRFEINPEEADIVKLSISSKLYAVAKIISGDNEF